MYTVQVCMCGLRSLFLTFLVYFWCVIGCFDRFYFMGCALSYDTGGKGGEDELWNSTAPRGRVAQRCSARQELGHKSTSIVFYVPPLYLNTNFLGFNSKCSKQLEARCLKLELSGRFRYHYPLPSLNYSHSRLRC